MPRELRVEYEGAVYQVMNPGDRREQIMPLKWKAERLHTGSWTHVPNCLAATRNQ